MTGKLSFDSQQPLVVSAGDTGIDAGAHVRAVADAQLTNAASLRAELARLGHACRDESDTRLIAHAYAAWGPACAKRLRGAFACAIWDERCRRLVLARDHMGMRPLYFAVLPDEGVAFASEIRPLLADPRVGHAWSPTAVDAYLALGYIPAPLTPYRRVTKLEAAQMIVVEGRGLHAEQYWEPRPAYAPPRDADLLDAMHRRLESAVRREIRAGAADGLLYSGGPASTTLLAAAPRSAGKAITVAVEQDGTELTRSHAAAARLRYVRELETLTFPMAEFIARCVPLMEEPAGDPAAVAQLAVCTAARRHTDSALAAHGASMLWGGGDHRPQIWDGFRRRGIYTRGFAWQVRDAAPLSDTYLADGVLAAAHRASTATGLRLRFPFLEPELVQLALTRAGGRNALGHRRRAPLQLLLGRTLPHRLLPLPSPQQRRWWIQSALSSMVPSYLMSARFDGRGIVSLPALVQLWNEHRAGRCDHSRRLWALVMLECWFREFIDDRAAGEPLEYAAVVRVA
jgi:asparagine synthetase B (glutamine-hydrolysing)